MPRPCKNRFVNGQPTSVVYKPAGIKANCLEWVCLSLDEFETLRLLDHSGLNQEQAAEKMGVSRTNGNTYLRLCEKESRRCDSSWYGYPNRGRSGF